MKPRALAVLVPLLLAAVHDDAQAAPHARLEYVRGSGAEDCPDEPALRAAVATRLGYDPFSPESPSSLRAEITRDATTYRASVTLIDGTSEPRARSLDHPSCPALIEAVALTISIAIDPRSLTGPVALAPAPVPAPAPSPSPAPAPSSPSSTHVFTTLTPTLSFGAAPSPAVGLVGGLGLSLHPFTIALEARGDLPSSRHTSAPASGTVSTSLLAATIAPCFRASFAIACALGTAGRIAAEARGIAAPRTDSAVHAFAGARLGIAQPVTAAFDVRAHADLLYALTPQTLQIDGKDAYSLPRVSVQLAIGAALHFF